MKIYRNALILILVLAVLGGAYYFVGKMKPKDAENKGPESISIFQTEKDKVSEISITQNGQELAFVKQDKDWKLKSGNSIKLNQSKVDSLAYDAASINADQLIEEKPQDLTKYGLQSSTATVVLKLNDGTSKTFLVGDKTPTKTGYYFMEKDGNQVYTINSAKGDSFLSLLDTYRDKTLFSIKQEDITAFTIEGKNRKKISVRAKTEQSNDQTGALSTWDMSEPWQRNVDNQAVTDQVLTKIPQIAPKDVEEDKPADLSKYGLAAPEYTITFSDKNNNTTKLLLGNTMNDVIYLKMDGNDTVYTVDAKSVDFKDIDPFQLIEKFAFIPNIDTVSKFVITAGGKQSTFEVIKSGDTSQYKVDGKDADESGFKKFYQAVIGIQADGVVEQPVQSGTPDVSYTFYFNNGTPEVKVDYVSIDDRNYAIIKDGQCEFYTKKKQVSAMLDAMAAFVQDPGKKVE